MATTILEDFEDSTYATPITGTWARSAVRATAGTWSMKSAAIGNSGTSDMVVTLPNGTGTIDFDYWVSSEADFDLFRVLINGTTVLQDSGVPGTWRTSGLLTVPAGATAATFRYTKDSFAAIGEDAVWIDQLRFIIPTPPGLTGDREGIAAALSTIGGVTGYTYRPTTPQPGDAWPLLGPMERAAGLAFYVTWRVLVFLPQDERAASVWMDAHVEELVAALEPWGFVDRIEPVALTASGTDQYALQVTMRSE